MTRFHHNVAVVSSFVQAFMLSPLIVVLLNAALLVAVLWWIDREAPWLDSHSQS